MNLRKFTYTLILLFAAWLPSFAQTDSISIQTIAEKAGKYNSEHPVEKVYLHFDKPYYAVGDTIWFKAYLTMDLHQPSTISKIIYVDIISSKDSVVKTLKLPVTGSIAFGDITLSAPLFRQGNYHIRAYTNWMRNFDPAYYFNKTIPIGTIVDKEVFANISLSGSQKNNTAKIDADIHYNTPDGRSYSNRKVNWKVVGTDYETISKGKGTTDLTGHLVISFTTNKIDELKLATLQATIDLDNKSFNNSFSLKHATEPVDVQFFPEGGDLVNGIRSKVAFKALNSNGLGIDVKGSIMDNTGKVVTAISSQHLGMGVFDLAPESGKTYKAAITFPDGSQNTYSLPQAKADGITMAITNTDPDKIGIRFSASDGFFAAYKNKSISILGQHGQIVCYGAKVVLTEKAYISSIPKNKFPTGSGITKITLFAPNGDVLAERIFFLKTNDLLNVNLSTAKTTYAAKEKVTVNVLAKKGGQLPAEANLSVTVLDEKRVPYNENAETTILTNLLLTSDLKGYVEKPNYYFINANDKTNADLDVLMLTQGYRRFMYKDLLANKMPEIKFLPEDGITITGTLRSGNGMPLKGNVNLVIKDKHISLNTLTNQLGEFKFSKLYFPDSVEAVISAKGNYNANNLMIMRDNDVYQKITPNLTTPDEITNIDTALNAYLQNNKLQILNSHMLKEVVINSKAPEKKPSHSDYPTLMGLSPNADQTITADRMEGCPTVFDCLKGIAAQLVFDNENLYVRRDFNQGNRKPVQVYFNEMPVDLNYLQQLQPGDIESVEVFVSDGLSGINRNSNTNGVLVVNGKKEVKTQMTQEQIRAILAGTQNSAQSFLPKGYYIARVFYSPKYDVSKDAPLGGDLRSTVYWNPKVLTDKNGNASFDYYNADGNTTYRVIIEGFDADGNIGRTVYRYKVN